MIRRIVTEEGLKVKFLRLRKYNLYAGEITPSVPNLLKRDFKADQPNKKWLTDITEFHISSGKVYLSPMIDCSDDTVISWTINTKLSAQIVNSMLDIAVANLNLEDSHVIHSNGVVLSLYGVDSANERSQSNSIYVKQGVLPG